MGLQNLPMVYGTTFAPPEYSHPLVLLGDSYPQVQWCSADQVALLEIKNEGKEDPADGGPGLVSIPHILKQKTLHPPTLERAVPPSRALPSLQVHGSQSFMGMQEEDLQLTQVLPPRLLKEAPVNGQPSPKSINDALLPDDERTSASTQAKTMARYSVRTTSPIAFHGLQPIQLVPEMISALIEQLDPASIVSVPEVRIAKRIDGLQVTDETTHSSASEASPSGLLLGKSQAASGNLVSARIEIGDGKGPAERAVETHVAKQWGPHQGANVPPNDEPKDGPDEGLGPSVQRIQLPKDGQFGVVVVGSSLVEQYPETSGVWSGRLAYTVYLHLGLEKSWILQYSMPRKADAAAGSPTRPAAPWPYDIMRPSLDVADSAPVMVHGFVDATGHFEHLAVLYPEQFEQKDFLLESLQQWKFRPAMQNSQATEVEVLLIIPSQVE